MRGWGVVLLIIGVGSFILPYFGRQFILVSMFGPTASGVMGILFAVVGLVLLILSFVMKKEAPNTGIGRESGTGPAK